MTPNIKMKKLQNTLRLGLVIFICTLGALAGIALALYFTSCKMVNGFYAVPGLNQLPKKATCTPSAVNNFIIGDSTDSSRAVFSKESYVFNFTNNFAPWQAMLSALAKYNATADTSLDAKLGANTQFNVSIATFNTSSGVSFVYADHK